MEWDVGSTGYFSHIFFGLWLQKLALLDTYRRLHTTLCWEKVTMISYIGKFAATYVTVQVVTFTECNPFSHYWIVLPDSGMLFSLSLFFRDHRASMIFAFVKSDLCGVRLAGILCNTPIPHRTHHTTPRQVPTNLRASDIM